MPLPDWDFLLLKPIWGYLAPCGAFFLPQRYMEVGSQRYTELSLRNMFCQDQFQRNRLCRQINPAPASFQANASVLLCEPTSMYLCGKTYSCRRHGNILVAKLRVLLNSVLLRVENIRELQAHLHWAPQTEGDSKAIVSIVKKPLCPLW